MRLGLRPLQLNPAATGLDPSLSLIAETITGTFLNPAGGVVAGSH